MTRLLLLVTSLCFLAIAAEAVPFQAGKECPDDEMYTQYPDDEDCKGFYICLYGKKAQAKCPSTMLYNKEKMKCDRADRVVCGVTQRPTTSAPTTNPETSTEQPQSSDSTPEEQETTGGGPWTTENSETPKETDTTEAEAEISQNTEETPESATVTEEQEVPETTENFEPEQTTEDLPVFIDEKVEDEDEGEQEDIEIEEVVTTDPGEENVEIESSGEIFSEDDSNNPSTDTRQLIPLVPTGGPWTEFPPVSQACSHSMAVMVFAVAAIMFIFA